MSAVSFGMADFEAKWTKDYKPSAAQRISEALSSPPPLKPRIDTGIRLLRAQKQKLGMMISKIESRDKHLFQKVVMAHNRKDTNAARVLASELGELRSLKRTMTMARLSLEKIEIRLTMYSGLGDTVATISPAVSLLKNMQGSLGRFMPEANAELAQMTDLLSGFMQNTLGNESLFGGDQTYSNDVDSIMEEAAAVATDSVGSRLPSTPAHVEQIRAANKLQ